MSDRLIFFINILSFFGSVISIIGVVVAYFSSKRLEMVLSKLANGETPVASAETADKTKQKVEKSQRKNRSGVWPFVLIVTASLISLLLLLYGLVYSPEILGWEVYGAFVVSGISLLVYAYKAYYSFDKYYILPPEKLWQVLFNKIPSHVDKTNQLVFKFLVLKMEDSEEVNDAGQRIEASYAGREDFQVVVKSVGEQVSIEDYCGVIFIVGEQCYNRQGAVLELMEEYSKRLILPIAYIRVGENHYRLRKFHRISSTYLDKHCANHLIMRSYRRSEHWIRLSKYGQVALWATMGLAAVLLISFVVAEKRYVSQKNDIKQIKDCIAQDSIRISCLQDSLKLYGDNRRDVHLSNTYEKTFLPDNLDINALQEDVAFQSFVGGIADYFFGEVEPQKILLWLRNDHEGVLECIFDSKVNAKFNEPKGSDSMIGGIANHKSVFVFWPGCLNNNSIWYNPDNKMAWYNDEHAAFFVSELTTEKNKNISMKLQQTSESEAYELKWHVNEEKDQTENAIALYGFSYDGRLAIELDFEYNELNNKESKRIYIQNLVFRNTVRKFSACITSYINSWDKTR